MSDSRLSVSVSQAVAAAFAFVSVAVSITIWSLGTFQTKEDAREDRQSIDQRIAAVEEQVLQIQMTMQGVARDTAYIRGRLEPTINGRGER